VAPVVLGLAGELTGDVRRDGALRPHLAVRVRVARAHHLAAVLEQLDVPHVGAGAELRRLLRPQVDHGAHARRAERGEGEVVPRREADDAAGARLGLRGEQPRRVEHHRIGRRGVVGGVGLERRVVVGEDEGARVVGVALAVGAHVPGAQVARGVVGRTLGGGRLLDLALPGALRTVRGDEHPLTGERVEAAVRAGGEGAEAVASGRGERRVSHEGRCEGQGGARPRAAPRGRWGVGGAASAPAPGVGGRRGGDATVGPRSVARASRKAR
jgi:hypothetical protein